MSVVVHLHRLILSWNHITSCNLYWANIELFGEISKITVNHAAFGKNHGKRLPSVIPSFSVVRSGFLTFRLLHATSWSPLSLWMTRTHSTALTAFLKFTWASFHQNPTHIFYSMFLMTANQQWLIWCTIGFKGVARAQVFTQRTLKTWPLLAGPGTWVWCIVSIQGIGVRPDVTQKNGPARIALSLWACGTNNASWLTLSADKRQADATYASGLHDRQ